MEWRRAKPACLDESSFYNNHYLFTQSQCSLPGGGLKLEGEDDVIGVTYLANEATLSAQVTVVHMVGGIFYQRVQVDCKLALCYLKSQTCTCDEDDL